MIFSQLHFINLSIDVAEKFKNFEVKDFDALRLKIIEIRSILQKNESITAVEVILKLSFQEPEKHDNSKAINALIKEFAQKTPIIFQIEIISPQLDRPYYAALQAAFDEAYIQSLKTWHAQTVHNEQAVVTIGDLMVTTSSHNLAIMTQDREDLSEPRLDSVFSKRPNRPMRYNQVVQSSLTTSPHLQSHSATLAAFSNILPALEAFGGEAGIINLCDLVKNHPKQTIERFSQLFLTDGSINIQDIMSPSGLKQLKICFNDWSPWFFEYFLNLTQHHSDPAPPRLETFIEKMQQLWRAIEDFRLLQAEKNLDYSFDFFERIDHMLRLIEKTPPVWKKSQIEWMFALDWQKRDTIDKFLITDKCQWVHPKMFDADHRVQQFYIDAAKLMKSASIETLDSYIDDLNRHRASEQKFRLLSWFLSLEPAPRLAELANIILWFAQQTVADRQCIVDYCHAELIQGRINFEDFKDSFHLAIEKKCELLPLLNFQHQWQYTYPELQDSQWKTIFELLKHQDEPTSVIEKSTFSGDINFRIDYFSIMLRLIFNDADDILDDLIASFKAYTPDKQDLIINILRSLKLEQELTKPSAQALLQHLSAHARESQANALQQNLWQKAYPSLNFLYFASNINYEEIIDSLAHICQHLIDGIDKVLATTIPILFVRVEQLLQEPMLADLRSQQAALRPILTMLDGLKTSGKQQFDISFQGLGDIETRFDVFFNRTLGEAFGHLLLRLLPNLHPSLNKDSSIKDLLSVINLHHEKLPPAFKDIFPKKILTDLVKVTEGQSIVAMMMDKQLVAPTRDTLHAHLDKNLGCHERIQALKLAPLDFLGTITLNPIAIGHFFNRLTSVTAITSQWPNIEQKCAQYGESPLEIWQLCIKHQQGATISSYWRGCFDILEHLFKHHHNLETLGDKRFIKLFELLLKQKNSFPEGLSANGEISHPNWQVFLKFLDNSLSPTIYSQPAFTCLFPIGIQSTLSNGQEFKFAEMSRIFAELSEQDSPFLPILIANLQHPDEHTQKNTEQLIQKLGPIFKACESGPLELLRIMLTPEHLEKHLEDILKILDCIKNHPEFDLLGIILNDKSRFDDSFITQLSGFVDVFLDLPAPWKITYQKTFLQQEPTAEKIDVPTMNEYAWWQPSRYWGSKPSAPTPPTVPKEQEVPNFWPIITLAPYPRIEQLSSWLKSPPEASRLEIEAFDVSPTDAPKQIPTPSDADFSRWIQELECYDGKWSRDQKFKLAARLKNVWTLGNYFCAESRTSLIEKFHTHRHQLLAETAQDTIELENRLIGILAAIYQKIDQKMPYPTQLLALLMVLEYGRDHLIAEVDTSEGKATIIAILAILKWSRRNENTVLVYTHTSDLVAQDFYQKKHLFLFRLLNIRANPIEADSPLTSLQPNGIYYTTQDDMRVFREKQRLQGIDT
ncbi:MAG: hypothetical protein EBY16_06065, partial [Gammaproteobacteria bacterium]|nr:hypothetical protein [Gammaproteobacteria bacterium]